MAILLQQENTEGLEASVARCGFPDDADQIEQVFYPPTQSWIPVPVKSGSYVINMGDMMQKITAGFYRSARHRVLTNKSTRLSAPFFLNGNLDQVWRPLDGSPGEMTIGAHVRQRLGETIGGEAGKALRD